VPKAAVPPDVHVADPGDTRESQNDASTFITAPSPITAKNGMEQPKI